MLPEIQTFSGYFSNQNTKFSCYERRGRNTICKIVANRNINTLPYYTSSRVLLLISTYHVSATNMDCMCTGLILKLLSLTALRCKHRRLRDRLLTAHAPCTCSCRKITTVLITGRLMGMAV